MDKQEHKKKVLKETEFFTGYREANRYKILEMIGKGSYGVVCAAIDRHTGEKVAIKKISNNFEQVSDAIRILREIKLLRLLRHPDIVEIKQIMLPPSRREFRDIYVVFELMESDLHQVIKANNDLTHEHHRFFLYQMLRALKYMHTANVYHRDLKPKNVLANANCKLKICDFGLARVAFNDTPTTTFWTDYIATRWYRAPELCGSFFSKYTPAIDIWSIGCIFAEVLTGKPLFPGKSVAHQLELITDLLGTPSADKISGVRNDKARKYLMDMRKKCQVSFSEKFPNANPLALKLLQRLLAFDPKDRPSAEEALADPYFKGLAKIEREPSCQPISKVEFEFERRRVTKEYIRELIFQEVLEYHPELQKDYMAGNNGSNFLYPSAIGGINKQFAYLEEDVGKSGPVIPPERKHVSLPRPTVNSCTVYPKTQLSISGFDKQKTTIEGSKELRVQYDNPGNQVKVSQPPPRMSTTNGKLGIAVGPVLPYENIRHTSNSDDHRRHAHDAILPAQSISATSSFLGKNQENCRIYSEMEKVQKQQLNSTNNLSNNIETKAPAQQYTPAKLNHEKSTDMNSKPYYQVEEKVGTLSCQIGIDAELLSAQSQFVAAGAVAIAAAAHREVGAVHLGLT